MTLAAIAIDLGTAAVAVGALAGGASAFVTGATRIARRLGVSGLIIGLTVVAFGTSAPEFAVTLDAALTAKSNISVANVVGSNVVNLGFVLGGAALVRAIPITGDLLRRDGAVLVGTTVLAILVLRDLRVSRAEGGLLVVLLVAYLAVLVRTGSDRIRAPETSAQGNTADAIRLVAGLAGVVIGAHLLVLSASDLAREAGVSEWIIGATVVALGTSAPEFVTSVVAARRGRAGLSAGNIVGSCVFNVLGVLGLAAVVRPLPVVGTALESAAWLLVAVLVATALFWSRRVLSRAEGAVLVGLNALNWLVGLLF